MPMTAGLAAKPPRPRRLGLYLPFTLLLLIALGWSAVWFYGRHRINQEIDAFLARQASLGREWSCPDRRIGGFPFRIEGRCTDPSYRQRTAEGEAQGSLKGLTVVATTAGALNLAHVITEFEGPLTVRAPGLPESVTTWRSARSSIRGGIDRLERLSIEIEAPVVTVGGARWSAERLTAHLREGVDPAQPGAYDLAVRLDKAAIPEADALLASAEPVNLELDSRVLRIGALDRQDWRRSIEAWRANGGTIRIERLRLAKGAPRIEATGDLRLDEQRRVEGRLDANFINAGAILQQFGVGGGPAGLIGALLGGGRRPDAERREPAVRLPLTLEGGRVAVGPFRIPGLQLRPLY
jgi:hypothetical protein